MEANTDNQTVEDVPEVWLTLAEAGELLNVSASTIRRWADAGRIPSRRTSGGHRRFSRAAVLALHDTPATKDPAEEGSVWSVGPQGMAAQHWHAHLTDTHATEQMRGLGQRLLGLLIQYLVWQGDTSRFLADGRAVGANYGSLAAAAGISMNETVEAFLYFRGAFWRLALQMPAVTHVGDAAEVAGITERIDGFMNAVLLATIAGYEQESAL